MAGFRFFNATTREHGSRHAGIEHGMAARLEPGAQLRDMCGAAYAVSAFDDDQLAAVFSLLDSWQRRSV